jgi:hypothetical protein
MIHNTRNALLRRESVCKTKLKKVPHLVYDRVKHFSAQKVPRNGKLSVVQANLGVIRVFHVEAREVEHKA